MRDDEMTEAGLRAFGLNVGRLINGGDLARTEARDMLRQVLAGDQPEMQQGAFLAALTAKGPTAKEIAGCWEAIMEMDTVRSYPRTEREIIENAGTGGDSFKTFNVSTAAAVIASAAGATLAKHGSRAITSKCGTIDLVERLGIDVDCPADVVTRSIEAAGIGLFNGQSRHVHPNALGRVLSGIRFGTVLNVSASLANPACPRLAARGVWSEAMVKPTVEAMREIGFKRAMVYHGLTADCRSGMDELSPTGRTAISLLHEDGTITSLDIFPGDVGMRPMRESDLLASTDIGLEAERFVRLLDGEDGARLQMACLNAAPVLFVSGLAGSLSEGMEAALSAVQSGRAIKKLRSWAACQTADAQASAGRLDDLLAVATD